MRANLRKHILKVKIDGKSKKYTADNNLAGTEIRPKVNGH